MVWVPIIVSLNSLRATVAGVALRRLWRLPFRFPAVIVSMFVFCLATGARVATGHAASSAPSFDDGGRTKINQANAIEHTDARADASRADARAKPHAARGASGRANTNSGESTDSYILRALPSARRERPDDRHRELVRVGSRGL